MRRGTIIFIAINFIIVCFLVNSVKTLLGLLFEDGSFDAIHRSDIPAPGSNLIDNRTQLIPKIIHQTYINSTIPERWKEPQQSCIAQHPDYEYKVCSGLLAENIRAKANDIYSSGPMLARENSYRKSTHGFSKLSTAIHIPFSALMRSATSYSHTMVEYISISMMAANVH